MRSDSWDFLTSLPGVLALLLYPLLVEIVYKWLVPRLAQRARGNDGLGEAESSKPPPTQHSKKTSTQEPQYCSMDPEREDVHAHAPPVQGPFFQNCTFKERLVISAVSSQSVHRLSAAGILGAFERDRPRQRSRSTEESPPDPPRSRPVGTVAVFEPFR